jgi:hypothetical protein
VRQFLLDASTARAGHAIIAFLVGEALVVAALQDR